MKPVIAIIGRPNVGKSTLFNRLTRSRDALVADQPGLTRDRHYGHGRVGDRAFVVVDTGGFEPVASEAIFEHMARQTLLAIDEADRVLFLVDGRNGLHPQDRNIADILRRREAPVLLLVNKAEGMRPELVSAEFHELGLGEPLSISAAHGDGVAGVVELALAGLGDDEEEAADEAGEEDRPRIPRVAIVGRPNVGKSTLINTLAGEERVVAFDQPGTTRDSIDVPLDYGGRPFVLVDTAGVRRRGKVSEAVEKFSVIKTLQAIDDANVAVLLLDARQEIADQDAHIASYILEAGRALVVGINKWDGLEESRRAWLKEEFHRKLRFLDFARLHFISALHGSGIRGLMNSAQGAFDAAMARLPTPKLSRTLAALVERQPPPKSGLFRPKLRYAHQGGSNPPIIVIHGNAVEHVAASYRRYLENGFREAFGLRGTPLRVEFRSGRNPFADRPRKPVSERRINRARREKRFRNRNWGG